ncbi:hypothetical protein COT30_01155 [Candidatus Micrarchaeota archaeon CG08_land_8_20_14_0_20_49_17]|nr:MAG: hypothetical protein AUJ13_00460 [Candidatus Micrarchaeota archaeon CG1_02_49_24]PIU10079.1 MAG: hypothetical protein COT30_01155 [Candidatus Micrarchaeota archaeon CG08_land_8_20_14_0_20_49_17]PIU81115.1 MAG: hypothetical protein COS70_05745 [Candidatus Micrarchaeota archaeon CG06_land_8_20_14_3_00_50_6]PIZ97064.1 MAG: hypothetical protein COX84_03385 [Candidatus Micrarchaeota archaeon CG_4_10_14_0_2_um_filter_49_7]HII53525.1 hypothetical protein [Candidatus Micrarchaeota archaeon]
MLGIILVLLALIGGLVNESVKAIMPMLALLSIILSWALFTLYALCVLLLAVLMKDYPWAAGIFFINPLAVVYRYLKNKEIS